MDYSKRGIQRKRRHLRASGDRVAHKVTGLITHLILISVIGAAVMVLCLGGDYFIIRKIRLFHAAAKALNVIIGVGI